jgi:uncharacterized protein (DUF4415 family)
MAKKPDPNATDNDNPEWTEADFARAVPFADMFPEQAKSLKNQGGRPKLAKPKILIGFRLAAELVEGIKATGKGYNARVEQVLRDALAQGKL